MSDEREEDVPQQGQGGTARQADPDDAGAPLSDDPGSAGKSGGTHGTDQPTTPLNPTPRREEAGM